MNFLGEHMICVCVCGGGACNPQESRCRVTSVIVHNLSLSWPKFVTAFDIQLFWQGHERNVDRLLSLESREGQSLSLVREVDKDKHHHEVYDTQPEGQIIKMEKQKSHNVLSPFCQFVGICSASSSEAHSLLSLIFFKTTEKESRNNFTCSFSEVRVYAFLSNVSIRKPCV